MDVSFKIALTDDNELVESSEIVTDDGSMLMLAQTEDGQYIHVPFNSGNDLSGAGYYIVEDDQGMVKLDTIDNSKEYYISADGTFHSESLEEDAMVQEQVLVDEQDYNVPYMEQEVECGEIYTDDVLDNEPLISTESVRQKQGHKRKALLKDRTPTKYASRLSADVFEGEDREDEANSSSVIQEYHPTISTLLLPLSDGKKSSQISPADLKSITSTCTTSQNEVSNGNTTMNRSNSPPILFINTLDNKTVKMQLGSDNILQTVTDGIKKTGSTNQAMFLNSALKPVLIKPLKKKLVMHSAPVLSSTSQPHPPKTKETLADKYIKHWKPTGQYRCKLCCYSCVTQNYLFRHWIVAHCSLRPYSCIYCGFNSANKDGITRHQTTNHKCLKKDVYTDLKLERTVIEKFNAIFQNDEISSFYDSSVYNQNSSQSLETSPLSQIIPSVALQPGYQLQVVPSTSTSTQTVSPQNTKLEPMTIQRLKQVLDGQLDDYSQHMQRKSSQVPLTQSMVLNPMTYVLPNMTLPSNAFVYSIPNTELDNSTERLNNKIQ